MGRFLCQLVIGSIGLPFPLPKLAPGQCILLVLLPSDPADQRRKPFKGKPGADMVLLGLIDPGKCMRIQMFPPVLSRGSFGPLASPSLLHGFTFFLTTQLLFSPLPQPHHSSIHNRDEDQYLLRHSSPVTDGEPISSQQAQNGTRTDDKGELERILAHLEDENR